MTDDIRRKAHDCPDCTARAGDLNCYTATGFPRPWHARRRRLALGETLPDKPAAGSLAGKRPTHKQAEILGWAIANNNQYELSGYRFHGDAQRRAAMTPMADETRGWFDHVRETDHGTLYKITEGGLTAFARYEAWMRGEK